MDNPYDPEVILTVTLVTGRKLTGQFAGTSMDPFWSLQTDDVPEPHWIDLNPAHIVSVVSASGERYEHYVKAFGLEEEV